MTYCDTLAEPLIRRIEVEKKNLDQIAKELCGNTVKRPRQKAIRIIKEVLGEDYLIKNAGTLGYNTVKAVRKSTTEEVVKRKIVTEKEVEDSRDVGETKLEQVLNEPDNVAPNACCQTVNTEHCETGQTKGQEQALEEHDTSAACCQERVVRQKIVSEKKDSEEEQEQELEEPVNAAPETKEFNGLVGEIKRLISLFTLDIVKRALAVAESEV
jgi:hypothetical protein